MYSPKIGPNTIQSYFDRRKDKTGGLVGDSGIWKAKFFCEKWHDTPSGLHVPADELITVEGNLLMYGGVSCLWECLIGNGTATGGNALTYFNTANAYIGIGDSSTASVATFTDLQASSNKTRVGMNSGYPAHTDNQGVSSANTITFQSSFGSSLANYSWNEVGVFNASSAQRMLNRLVQTFGSKASGSTWSMTVQITIS